MFVVVHHQQTIGVVRDKLQVPVVIVHGSVDVEQQIPCMKIAVDRGKQRLEARLRLGGDVLKVDRESAIARIGSKKRIDLLNKAGAKCCIGEEATYLGD